MLFEAICALMLVSSAASLDDLRYSVSESLPLKFSCPAGSEKIDLHGFQASYNGEYHNLASEFPAYKEVEDYARAECALQYENEVPGSSLGCDVSLNAFKLEKSFLIPALGDFEKFEVAYLCPQPLPAPDTKTAESDAGFLVLSCPSGEEVKILEVKDAEGLVVGDPIRLKIESDCNGELMTPGGFGGFCFIEGFNAVTYQCHTKQTTA